MSSIVFFNVFFLCVYINKILVLSCHRECCIIFRNYHLSLRNGRVLLEIPVATHCIFFMPKSTCDKLYFVELIHQGRFFKLPIISQSNGYSFFGRKMEVKRTKDTVEKPMQVIVTRTLLLQQILYQLWVSPFIPPHPK